MARTEFKRSKKLYESARRIITGGVHSGVRFQEPHPIYFKRAKGSRVWDVDENEYIDCIVSMGACVLGHDDSKVLEAVKAQLSTGLPPSSASFPTKAVHQKELSIGIPS